MKQPLLDFDYENTLPEDHKHFNIFDEFNIPKILESITSHCYHLLYPTKKFLFPVITQIKVCLKEIEPPAYASGDKKKVICVSPDYFARFKKFNDLEFELKGVLCHEITHCIQYSCSHFGFVEGLADFIRLKCLYIPKHWKRSFIKWDNGYDGTAYFLEWLDEQYPSSVLEINQRCKSEWSDLFFLEVTKKPIGILWKDYCREVGNRQVDIDLVKNKEYC